MLHTTYRKQMNQQSINYCDVSAFYPTMTGDPDFRGPIEETKPCWPGRDYTDFRFECQVQYPQQSGNDQARFKVSLTFDGKTDPNNSATHVITDSRTLTVSFPSIALKGNVGKSVTIHLFVLLLMYCELRLNGKNFTL